MNYKYLIVWLSYDRIAKKMTKLSQKGYEYDCDYVGTIIRMKKTNNAPKVYKFIYDKSFAPKVLEYYKASGWQLHKMKFLSFLRLAEGDNSSYPIFSDIETEYEIIRYRLLRFVSVMLTGLVLGGILLMFSSQLDSYIGETAGELVTSMFGGIFGFGLGGIVMFTPRYFRLRKEHREEFNE